MSLVSTNDRITPGMYTPAHPYYGYQSSPQWAVITLQYTHKVYREKNEPTRSSILRFPSEDWKPTYKNQDNTSLSSLFNKRPTMHTRF